MMKLEVEHRQINCQQEFQEIINQDKPMLLTNVNIGSCLEKWCPDYLADKLTGRKVIVHQSSQSKMSFLEKNFVYTTMDFDKFVREASSSSSNLDNQKTLYLRAIGTQKRGKDVANIWTNYPEIGDDFVLPTFMTINRDSPLFFSSVLRIASPGFNLWTHYDLMDNVLFNVTGTKKIVLFPPEDLEYLYMDGDKSKIVDIDDPLVNGKFPLFANATRHETLLGPGQGLFIPSLWLHNVTSIDFTVGVNVFWKNDQIAGHYDGGDIYGNKDLIPGGKALRDLKKSIEAVKTLTPKFSQFYARLMISEIKNSLL